MGVGELIFWFLLLVLIKFIFTRIFDLIEYKIKNNTSNITSKSFVNDNVSFEEFDSILDEEDLADLSDDELISFNDIELGEENENK